MRELIRHFFDETNLNMPLLHRPTFENAIRDGLHLHDTAFGATVLVVCALGSKYSEDPRVSLDIGDHFHTKGWKWYTQVEPLRNLLYSPPSLYELQLHAVRRLDLVQMLSCSEFSYLRAPKYSYQLSS